MGEVVCAHAAAALCHRFCNLGINVTCNLHHHHHHLSLAVWNSLTLCRSENKNKEYLVEQVFNLVRRNQVYQDSERSGVPFRDIHVDLR